MNYAIFIGKRNPNPSAMFQEQASRNEASVSSVFADNSGHRKRVTGRVFNGFADRIYVPE